MNCNAIPLLKASRLNWGLNLSAVLISIFTFYFKSRGQTQIPSSENFILNSGFENLRSGESYPDDKAQADRLADWETRTANPFQNNIIPHSPDWYYNFGTQPSFAHNGRGYLGMRQYELIQQDMGQDPFLANRKYRLSFYYKTSYDNLQYENSKICFYIAKSRVTYANEGLIIWKNNSNEDYCLEKYRRSSELNELATQKILIHSQSIQRTNNNLENWTKVSTIISMPNNGCGSAGNLCGYNWFVVQLENENAPPDTEGNAFDCEDGYIYLDDISITDASGCEYDCRVPLGEIESEIISPYICGGGDINGEKSWLEELFDGWNDDDWPTYSWGAKLKNAISFEILVTPYPPD